MKNENKYPGIFKEGSGDTPFFYAQNEKKVKKINFFLDKGTFFSYVKFNSTTIE